ncbi:MAG: segregation/condensation protein A [Firmicutes bacterium]|nr:segregation/condensation protein A [Bacillota bacterium]
MPKDTKENKDILLNQSQNPIETDSVQEEVVQLPDTPEYKYINSNFDEPIPYDILYSLCRQDKIDILNIHLSDITEKFIAYIRTLDQVNYDRVASFVSLASRLVEYKALMLLPRPKEEFETAEGDYDFDTELTLLRAEEYSYFKDITEKLEAISITAPRFYRNPMFSDKEFNVIIKDFSVDKMIKSFELLLEYQEFKSEDNEVKIIEKDPVTMTDKIAQILGSLREHGKVLFFSLLSEGYRKSELITTFTALLELMKYQVATAEQIERGGEIVISSTSETASYDPDKLEELLKNISVMETAVIQPQTANNQSPTDLPSVEEENNETKE